MKYRIYITGSITDWIELEGDNPEDLEEIAIGQFQMAHKDLTFDYVEVDNWEEVQ